MKLNLASGQRPFPKPWINLDIRDQGYDIDVIADMRDLSMYKDESVDVIVAHHCLEHVDMSEVLSTSKEWHRVLKQGGKLAVFVPNMRALVDAWLTGKIDNYIFNVNVYGAFQGQLESLHRWSYTPEYLNDMMRGPNNEVNWSSNKFLLSDEYLRDSAYAGSDCSFDFWILSYQFIK